MKCHIFIGVVVSYYLRTAPRVLRFRRVMNYCSYAMQFMSYQAKPNRTKNQKQSHYPPLESSHRIRIPLHPSDHTCRQATPIKSLRPTPVVSTPNAFPISLSPQDFVSGYEAPNNSSNNLAPLSPSVSSKVKVRIFNFRIFSTTRSGLKPMLTYLSTVSCERPYIETGSKSVPGHIIET